MRALLVTTLVFLAPWGEFARPQLTAPKIIPLISTRKDVEKLYGPSADKCECSYQTPFGNLYVDYSTGPCEGRIAGWNVGKDTVVSFTIYPSDTKRFSDLKLDLSKFRVRQDDTFTKYYASRDEGRQYAVSVDHVVSAISHVPSTRDRSLRCEGFPLEDGTFFDQVPFDQFGPLPIEEEKERLDTFAITLSKNSDLKGYIVVYAGKIACPEEAQLRANRARGYILHMANIAPERIIALNGGYRETTIERLYALNLEDDPPDLVTTLAPNKVQIMGSDLCKSLNTGLP